MGKILAIDPGNIKSGYVIIDENCLPIEKGKVLNDELLLLLKEFLNRNNQVTIEMIGSYGMNVGRSVFDTCIYIGRLKQICEDKGIVPYYIERRYIKLNLCGKSTANDTIVNSALVERFSTNDLRNHGKGTKKDPGFFYGFSADMWAAFALAATYIDIKNKRFTISEKGLK